MKIIKDYFYLSGSELASKVVTFAAMAYLARVAGPEGFGYLEFAGAVMLCAGLIVDQGFDPYGAREISKDPKVVPALVSEVVLVRIFLAVVAYALIILFAIGLDRPAIVTQLLLIYGLSVLVSPFLLRWVFQGLSQMGTAATVQVVRQFIYAAVVFATIRNVDQIWIAGFAELAGVIGAVIFGLWIYKHRTGHAFRARWSISRRLFVEGIPIGLSQLFWMIRMFGATVLVGIIAVPRDVGYFGAAMRIFIALHAFAWLYFFNLLPSMSQSWKNDRNKFQKLINNSLRMITWISVIVGAIWIVSSPFIMVTLYGADFSSAAIILQYLAIVFVIAAYSGHYRYGLIASGHQTAEMFISLIGACLAGILIPVGYRLLGPGGAALGLLVAETGVWLSAWFWSREHLSLQGHLRIYFWPMLIAGLSAGLVKLLSSSSFGVQALLVTMVVILSALIVDPEVRASTRDFVLKITRGFLKFVEERV